MLIGYKKKYMKLKEISEQEQERLNSKLKLIEQDNLNLHKQSEEINFQNETLKTLVSSLEEINQKAIKKEKMYSEIFSIIEMKIDDLRVHNNNFTPFEDEDGSWKYEYNMCSIGGCSFNYAIFETESEALRSSIINTIRGMEINISSACPECYSEYMKECM